MVDRGVRLQDLIERLLEVDIFDPLVPSLQHPHLFTQIRNAL